VTNIEKTLKEAKATRMPFESWAAFPTFCSFRDYGLERNIRKAIMPMNPFSIFLVRH